MSYDSEILTLNNINEQNSSKFSLTNRFFSLTKATTLKLRIIGF